MSLAVLLEFIAARHAMAQTGGASHPCSLLTPVQISAAVGRVGESREGDMPGTGRGANPLRKACSWSIPGGLFTLSVGKVPNSKLSTRPLLDYMNSVYDLLKGQGWKYEKRFREHELLAANTAGGSREWFACDELCDGGEGDAGDGLHVI